MFKQEETIPPSDFDDGTTDFGTWVVQVVTTYHPDGTVSYEYQPHKVTAEDIDYIFESSEED